jgi:hypothetical protein
MFYYYESNCLSHSLQFSYTSAFFLKTPLVKPYTCGCLVNTSYDIFSKQLRAQVINGQFA